MNNVIPFMKAGKIDLYEHQAMCAGAYVDHCRNGWEKSKELSFVFDEFGNIIAGKDKEGKAVPVSSFYVDPVFIEAYVSAGKTYIIGAIVYHMHKINLEIAKRRFNGDFDDAMKAKSLHRILVLADIGELVEQNAEAIWETGSPCSIFSATLNCKSTKFPTVVGSVKTVANALHTVFKSMVFRQIIIDECHGVDGKIVQELIKNPSFETTNTFAKVIAHFLRLNPKTSILGLTGTPYRGMERIDGEKAFWKKNIGPNVGREYLVERGYIVPTIFGASDLHYEKTKHETDELVEDGDKDYDAKTLSKIAPELMAQRDENGEFKDHVIMRDIMLNLKGRNMALITVASEKHALHMAEVIPGKMFDPATGEGDWCIITEKTKKADRFLIMKALKACKIKYTFHINCLTKGVNVPMWDTLAICRKMMSLANYVQLLGRGMRIPKDEHIKAGMIKGDNLVLDYSSTTADLHGQYVSPLLEEAMEFQKKILNPDDLKACPDCPHLNSPLAKRCMGTVIKDDGTKERCSHFYHYVECERYLPVTDDPNGTTVRCGTKNTKGARVCSACNGELRDPTEGLNRKHYTADEWKKVKSMTIQPAKNGLTIIVTIHLESKNRDGTDEKAVLTLHPFSSPGSKQLWKVKFVHVFAGNWPDRNKIMGLKTMEAIMAHKHLFRTPVLMTHRLNDKGQSIINKPIFEGEVQPNVNP